MPVNETLRVLRTVRYDGRHFSLFLQAGRIGKVVQPGQFVMVQPGSGLRPYLRRAFSVADVTTLSGVPVMELVVKVVGVGTEALGHLADGTALPVLGPLGKPFPLSDVGVKDRVAVVAGGIGLAPLLLLSRRLSERGQTTDLFHGGRNESDVLKRPDFERLLGAPRCRYATDDGSLGRKGSVVDLLTDSLAAGATYRRVYACGPVPMFRALAETLSRAGIDASFALEAEMACGFGVCLGCVVPAAGGGFLTVCKEGPCLPRDAVDWSRL